MSTTVGGDAWRTRIDPKHAAALGVTQEVHAAFFQPLNDHAGVRDCVAVMIPETPPSDVKRALMVAATTKARLLFVCDTHDQAEQMAAKASAVLKQHRRVPYERAEAGQWGPL